MAEDRPPDARQMGLYLALAQVGLEMVAPMFLGLVIDNYAGTLPWFMIAGIILGFVGGIYHIVILTRKLDAARREREKPGSNAP